MPVRARKRHRKILAVLVFSGVNAGLAAGALRSDESLERAPSPELATAFAPLEVASEPTGPAADSVAADDTAAPLSAPPAPVAAAPASPAAAIVPADRLYLEPILAEAARRYGLPADLILAQAWAESSWKIDAVSHKGAVGVLQLMPQAVDFVSGRLLGLDRHLDALNPTENAQMGARYMRHLIDRLNGDLRQALIAYNQGLAGLRRKGAVPAAVAYADKVLALRPVFAGT